MATELPKAYDPTAIEDHWAEYWVRENLFAQPVVTSAAKDEGADSQQQFSILLPPPNVTGRLHMGHMLNQTEMDEWGWRVPLLVGCLIIPFVFLIRRSLAVPALEEKFELLLTPDERAQARGVECLEAALRCDHAGDPPGVDRGVKPVSNGGNLQKRRFQQPTLFDFTKTRSLVILEKLAQ